MSSREWDDAVALLKSIESKEVESAANRLYMESWYANSPEWRMKHHCGPQDAALLHIAIKEAKFAVFGKENVNLSDQADEYEETMKAEEIMEGLN